MSEANPLLEMLLSNNRWFSSSIREGPATSDQGHHCSHQKNTYEVPHLRWAVYEGKRANVAFREQIEGSEVESNSYD